MGRRARRSGVSENHDRLRSLPPWPVGEIICELRIIVLLYSVCQIFVKRGTEMKSLGVEAHPDDVDLLCSGTLSRLAKLGHEVAILAVTAGELGTMGTSREGSISNRLKEARNSAA